MALESLDRHCLFSPRFSQLLKNKSAPWTAKEKTWVPGGRKARCSRAAVGNNGVM